MPNLTLVDYFLALAKILDNIQVYSYWGLQPCSFFKKIPLRPFSLISMKCCFLDIFMDTFEILISTDNSSMGCSSGV